MKTHIANSFILIFFIISLGFNQVYAQGDEEKSIIATYIGIDTDGKFEFIDEEKKIFLFDDVLDDIDIDLFDDDNLNQKLKIFWEEEEIEEVDEDENLSGKKVMFKTIIDIKKIEE